jgi:hypothetical protein
MIEKASLTLAINDAWAVIAILTVTVLIFVPFVRSASTAGPCEVTQLHLGPIEISCTRPQSDADELR